MKKIVIMSVYGYENIGDGAILDESLNVIKDSISGKFEINIHASNIKSLELVNKKNIKISTYLNPYGLAIKDSNKNSNLQKVKIFGIIYFKSVTYLFLSLINPKYLPKYGDFSYLSSLRNADVIFSVGGGYLRTKNKYKDFYGLLLTILPIKAAHFFNKKIIFLPMSFGNFATKFQERITFNSIKNDVLFIRDDISWEILKKRGLSNSVFYSPDLALHGDVVRNSKKKNYAVLTARNWLESSKQELFERELAKFVEYLWKENKLKTIFVPMAWNKNEDDDIEVAYRVKSYLINKEIFEIRALKTSREVKVLLSSARLAICTRMHSAIFAYLVNTPFIGISYEHKMDSFMKTYISNADLLKIQNVSLKELINKLNKISFSKKNRKSKNMKLNYQREELVNLISQEIAYI